MNAMMPTTHSFFIPILWTTAGHVVPADDDGVREHTALQISAVVAMTDSRYLDRH
jgi:hypothetical protein